MTSLPFSLNFFKQIEYFQEIKRLDSQFEKMFSRWKKGAYKKKGLSKSININYPTWELEKKILLWTFENHKHLGSPITTAHLSDQDFQKDIHATKTELCFAGKEEILRNLVSRGLAIWENGAIISQKGLDCGVIINDLYELKKNETIQDGETKYREEFLKKRRSKWLGYNLIYFSGMAIILATFIFLGLNILKAVNLIIPLSVNIKVFFKYMFVFIGFAPVVLFSTGLFLIKARK